MNTIAWLGPGSLGSYWLATYAFNTLSENALGVAFLALFLFSLAMAIRSAFADWSLMFGEGSDEE